ncbi:MAG: GNAT family N-acetyltransferase [Chloroflexi bacterium]|nr:GNAT family N-acetyltransferase [Chloroflexota bacterium]
MFTEPQIAEQFDIRFPQDEDAEQIANLKNRCSMALVGVPSTNTIEVRSHWNFDGMDREKDFRVVWDGDTPVAYGEVWNDDPPFIRAWVNAYVHPDYQNQGLGTYITRWAEQRARETFEKAPADAKLLVVSGAYSHHQDAIELLENEGYEKTRIFWTMKIDLDHDIPEPQFPPNIHMTTFAEFKDLRAMANATDDAFLDHWGYVSTTEERRVENWAEWTNPEKSPNYDATTFWLALDGDEIAGMSLCTPTSNENKNHGYVYTLGVRRTWRRQGLALAMLHFTFREMKARGKEVVLLDVDSESLTGATRLYEKAGMYVLREGVDYEKVMRDGIDYRTLSVDE